MILPPVAGQQVESPYRGVGEVLNLHGERGFWVRFERSTEPIFFMDWELADLRPPGPIPNTPPAPTIADVPPGAYGRPFQPERPARPVRAPAPDRKQVTLFSGFSNWTQEDQALALAEGWDIFNLGSTGVLEICMVDEAGLFSGDDEARHYVALSAAAGSEHCIRALLHLAHTIIQSQLDETVESDAALVNDLESLERPGEPTIQWCCSRHSQGTLLRTTYTPREHTNATPRTR